MSKFLAADFGSKLFLLQMAESAFHQVRITLQGEGGSSSELERKLDVAVAAMRKSGAEMADLCNTAEAANSSNAEIVFYEAGLIANKISPTTVTPPEQYKHYYSH